MHGFVRPTMATTGVNPTLVTYIYDFINETVDFYNDTTNATSASGEGGTAVIYPQRSDYYVRLVLYVIIFVVSTIGNIAVLCSLLRGRRRKSRVNLLILHLTVADLMITLFNIPMDFFWILTIQWYGGDVMCRLCMYVAMVAMYASPFVLIVISLDRFASIVFPLSVRQADIRCKVMLQVSWVACFVISIPQLLVHEVMAHYDDPTFLQCVDYNFMTKYRILWHMYHWFVVCATYVIPLAIIVGCYTAIVIKIFGSSTIRSYSGNNGDRMTLRRSGADTLPKARTRALVMTGAIVTAFIVCWTPSNIQGAIIHIKEKEDKTTPIWLQQVLLALLFSNAAIDPIVYGMFTVDFRRYFPGCFEWRGRRIVWRGRKISRRSTTSSNNYPQMTYASSTRLGAPTGSTANYHVISADTRQVAERCV
ncbi:gonadotropin-releasing hormone II receptor-like [Acanthaster planci]|uniref:Gonadotropin-releasing hormone II receptor-like n=1 Tax=Acanthaster planci TaxID=133434 RepID=A0A8B7ZGJ8_ACAPL|nr:gonadotropin-releasing hormone II receptor-like [Acanthaster planci]XP_022104728.1 gonadotropin-releasing hormone II receptor-like [Acanthaster planci]XP_022104729.1 gonadotropin-releasing hormone II receptor-like [Acanthaster planci]XP_022104730.1 gonadotropin-releasing hormone II receptor-like [Acanthaster planci]XP_022104731.1 gonadotropin-releasing hormone II receptor-like [Acanthaster planci]